MSKEKKGEKVIEIPKESLLRGFSYCLQSFPMWCILLMALFYYGAFLSYNALSTVFVVDYYHMSLTESSFIVSLLWIGSIAAAPIVGYVADTFGKRHFLLNVNIFCGLIPFAILSVTNKVNIVALTLFLGFSYGGFPTILYSIIPMAVDKKYLGVANGLVEVANAWGVFIFPALFGIIYEKSSPTVGIAMFTILLSICIFVNILLSIYNEYKLGGNFSKGMRE